MAQLWEMVFVFVGTAIMSTQQYLCAKSDRVYKTKSMRRSLPANQRLSTEAPLFNVQEHHLHNLLKVFNSQLILFQESSHRDLMNSLVLLSQFPNGEGWNLLILKVEETQARISFLNYFYKLLSQRFVDVWSSSESVSRMPIDTQHQFIIIP